MFPWYLPTMYGDIQLRAQGSSTQIEWTGLSPFERQAMETLQKKTPFDLQDQGTATVPLKIEKVEKILATSMKRGRKLLSAVVFAGGRIEEIHRAEMAEPKTSPFREKSAALVPAAPEEPKAAVTVAQPTIGCPVPEFERADVRATRVLQAFLTPQQLADFERTQSFVVTGADSGHRYLLTSRQAPAARLDRVEGRSVYDLTEGYPVCVHDWLVPAAEELLELKLFLELASREKYVRGLPEAFA
jgi:hypothetical protein